MMGEMDQSLAAFYFLLDCAASGVVAGLRDAEQYHRLCIYDQALAATGFEATAMEGSAGYTYLDAGAATAQKSHMSFFGFRIPGDDGKVSFVGLDGTVGEDEAANARVMGSTVSAKGRTLLSCNVSRLHEASIDPQRFLGDLADECRAQGIPDPWATMLGHCVSLLQARSLEASPSASASHPRYRL